MVTRVATRKTTETTRRNPFISGSLEIVNTLLQYDRYHYYYKHVTLREDFNAISYLTRRFWNKFIVLICFILLKNKNI